MTGTVDERGRAMLSISASKNKADSPVAVTAWIDTAFDGYLVFSQRLIDELHLDSLIETEAVLADGSKVVMESYICFIYWFGELRPAQVIANDGRFPLSGTAMLTGRVLHIDYAQGSLSLT